MLLRRPLTTALLTLLLATPAAETWGNPSGRPAGRGDAAASLLTATGPGAELNPGRLVLLDPTPARRPSPRRRTSRGTQAGWLARYVDLRLRPAAISAPLEAGRRYGDGHFGLSLPLGRLLELRGGVRIDYDNRPSAGNWVVRTMPSFGFGLKF